MGPAVADVLPFVVGGGAAGECPARGSQSRREIHGGHHVNAVLFYVGHDGAQKSVVAFFLQGKEELCGAPVGAELERLGLADGACHAHARDAVFLEKADHAAELAQMEQFKHVGALGGGGIGVPLKSTDDHSEPCGAGLLCHKAGKLTAARNDADILCHDNSE